MNESGHITTTLHKTIPRRPARIFGIYAIVFGALGMLFFTFTIQSWARETADFYQRYYKDDFGEAYEKIYNIEVPVYGLMAVNSLIVLVAGIGLLLREKWSADALWICGLIYIAALWILLCAKNLLWANDDILSSTGPTRTLATILTPYVLTLVISATLIVPTFIPAVRVSLHKSSNFVKRKRR